MKARENEIDTEDHMFKIAEREEGRLFQEISRLQKEMDELKERKNIYEVSIKTVHNLIGLGLIKYCKIVLIIAEQHLQANTEAGRAQSTDELGPASS